MTCIICLNPTATSKLQVSDVKFVNCPRCGEYSLSGTAEFVWQAELKTSRQIANASGWIRERPRVQVNQVEALENLIPPSIAKRGEKLLTYLETVSEFAGKPVHVDLMDNPKLLGLSWSANTSELKYLLNDFLCGQAQFIYFEFGSPASRITITPKGYAYLESLRSTNAESEIGFCAMWFDDSLRPLWEKAIKPAIEMAGFEAKIMYEHSQNHNNKIDDEIIAMLRHSKFVVADFTHGQKGMRGGVYYEAGFAEGLGLEVICTCRKDLINEDEIHFDNRQSNFILWEEDKYDDFRKAIQMRIERTIGRGSHRLTKLTD
jgi:hypothetical protein